MANLSDLFPADTKRGRLAELLYQRSIAQPEPQPDIRTTPPQIMGGLLGMIDSAKRKVGKNLSELVNNPDQYLRLIAERLPETAMKQASDPGNFIPGGGLIAQTAWHGSPHKFAKFQMDKIGTGEGAQAYGHGLYLAEAKDVADQYRINLSYNPDDMKIGGVQVNDYYNKLIRKADKAQDPADLYDKAGIVERLMANEPVDSVESWANGVGVGDWFRKEIKPSFSTYGNLYKTDIPDEAVARFLDWDKPLSQQAPEVQAALPKLTVTKNPSPAYGDEKWLIGAGDSEFGNAVGAYATKKEAIAAMNNLTGRQLYSAFEPTLGNPNTSALLQKQGIHGIRYLDGGSRGAGQGSSNFVVFDEDMIRILERNGEPTGLQPWAPGEYQLRDLLPK